MGGGPEAGRVRWNRVFKRRSSPYIHGREGGATCRQPDAANNEGNADMSALQKALDDSRRKLGGGTAAVRGNLILRPSEFRAESVVGTILSGAWAGREVEIGYAGTLRREDYTDKDGRSYVDIANGGTLRVEGVGGGKEGVRTSRWMLTFNGRPKSDRHRIVHDAVCSYVDTGFRDAEGRPKLRIDQLMLKGERHVSTIDDLRDAIGEGFASEGAVTLFGMDGGSVVQAPFFLSGKFVDGAWVPFDPAERADETIEAFGEAAGRVREALANGGFSVVPTRRHGVGAGTAGMIESSLGEAARKGVRARITTIDPENWACPTIGMRLSAALNRKGAGAPPEGAGAKLAAAFKSHADKDGSARFGQKGFRGLTDGDLAKFFASSGVELTEHPARGWSTQSLLVDQPEGVARGFVIKAFKLKPTTPYPPVAACADARAAYYSEMGKAVLTVIGGGGAAAVPKTDARPDRPEENSKISPRGADPAMDGASPVFDDAVSPSNGAVAATAAGVAIPVFDGADLPPDEVAAAVDAAFPVFEEEVSPPHESEASADGSFPIFDDAVSPPDDAPADGAIPDLDDGDSPPEEAPVDGTSPIFWDVASAPDELVAEEAVDGAFPVLDDGASPPGEASADGAFPEFDDGGPPPEESATDLDEDDGLDDLLNDPAFEMDLDL